MKVLITSGGTEEYIDGVRSITNFSSGRTGTVIAEEFNSLGADVFLVHHKRSVTPQNSEQSIKRYCYTSFNDLDCTLKNLLSENKFDAVIHLSAVSDFSIESIKIGNDTFKSGEIEKIDSDDKISINLKKNPKIIDSIKNYDRSGKIILVGFKLTNTFNEDVQKKAIKKIISRDCVDYLVHNDLNQINADKHIAHIYNNNQELLKTINTKSELAKSLYDLLSSRS